MNLPDAEIPLDVFSDSDSEMEINNHSDSDTGVRH